MYNEVYCQKTISYKRRNFVFLKGKVEKYDKILYIMQEETESLDFYGLYHLVKEFLSPHCFTRRQILYGTYICQDV